MNKNYFFIAAPKIILFLLFFLCTAPNAVPLINDANLKPAENLDPLMLDMKGDGIDLGGRCTTSLLTGKPVNVRWTKPGSDDAFLVINAGKIAEARYFVKDTSGKKIDRHVLFRDNLIIERPDGTEITTTGGWDMLSIFDSNKDGKIDHLDIVWNYLGLYTDTHGEGTMGISEITSIFKLEGQRVFAGIPTYSNKLQGFDDLETGQMLEVKGGKLADGSLVAFEVMAEEATLDDGSKIKMAELDLSINGK